MSTPVNPQDLHVRAPEPQQVQQPAPVQEPQQPQQPQQAPAPPQRVPLEDRQLTPEETESLLRGIMPAEGQELSNGDDPQQAQMAQDFFAQGPPGTPPAQSTLQGLPPALPPVVAQQVQAPPMPAPPAAVAPPDPQLASLQAQNSLLQAQIQAMQQQMQQFQQPQVQQPQPMAAPRTQQQPQPQQQFAFNVPDQYLSALAHEDPNVRRAALNGLLNGVAESVMQTARQEIEQRYSAVPNEITTRLATHSKAQQVQQDMFGTYPELAPHKQFVQAAAMQVAGNLGLDAWSADVRDAIAERVAPMVPGLMQRVQHNRAQRMAQMQGGGFGSPPVPVLPQVQGAGGYPQPVPMPQTGYAQPVGGVHGGPVYVRDAAGNLVPYQPQQQFVAGQQTRPGGRAVDPGLQDIWNTLGF